jgi:hypothetical protein
MASVRCTIGFNQGRQGWRESLYLTGVSLADALSKTARLALERAGLLGGGVQMVHLLVSDEACPRNTLAASGGKARIANPAAHPWSAVLLRLEAGPLYAYHRPYFMRGLPSSFFTDPKHEMLTPLAQTRLRDFVALVARLGFCLKVTDRATTCLPIIDVGPLAPPGAAINPSDFVIIQTAGPHGLTPFAADGKPTRVTVSGVEWFPPQRPGRKVNGNHPVLAVNDTQVMLGDTSAPATGLYVGGGVLQQRKTLYVPITGGKVLRVVKKKTGKALPFDLATVAAPSLPAGVPGPPAPAPAPPALPGLPGPRPFTSPAGTIANTHDLTVHIWDGYQPDVLSVAVAEDLDHPGTWLVAIPGTTADRQANWLNAVVAAFNIPTSYTNTAGAAVVKGIPPGSRLILAGHSQGGIVAQNIVGTVQQLGYNVTDVVCFGAPVSTLGAEGVHYVFFQQTADVVPLLSPVTLGGNAIATRFAGMPLPTILESDGSVFDQFTQHNGYPDNPALLRFDATGREIKPGSAPFRMRLGPVQRFGLELPKK